MAVLERESSRLPNGMLSIRFVSVAGIFLICTIGQAILPNGGNKSALPYLLREGGKDACLSESTFKGRAECLQALLESYYGEYFTMNCPFPPLAHPRRECKGCPWDRVNASMVNPAISGELNRSELFHPANASCSVANHVELYTDYYYIRRNVFAFGILGTLLLFLVTAYYSVSSSSEIEIENSEMLFGIRMPEPAFLLTLWILYHAGGFLLIISGDHVEFCEGVTDHLFQETARLTFYGILLMISLKRCRALRMMRIEEDVLSWGRYFASSEQRKRKRFLSFLLGPVVILFFLWELLIPGSWSENFHYNTSICYAGAKSWPFFTIQLAKISLEMFVVTVYTCGPSPKRGWFYFRYSMLMLSLLGSCTLFVLVWIGHDGFDVTFMMIPRVADSKIALPWTNMVHAICVSVMGLLEPIRIGWPERFTVLDSMSEDSARASSIKDSGR